ncbi:MAG TPA: response regulator [Acidobacteriaceae bacterium]|nr:response regulator [Acidobacteriaceae bacterium]
MESTSSNGRRVLIVDDEKVIAVTLSIIFAGKGYEVRKAYSAEEGLSILEGWAPDLALLDVCLPGMNGIDLAIHMKNAYPQCCILLISGKPDSMDLLDRATRSGYVLELMAKPVPPTVLLDRVAQLLA